MASGGISQPKTSSTSAVVPCLAYSCCSIMMMLLNKSLATKGERVPLSCVMLVQNLTTLCLVRIFDICLKPETKNAWKMTLPPFRLSTCLAWLPVNIIFLSMLFSGFKTLQLVTVSLVSVCKNVTNVFTTIGDRFLFGEPVSSQIVMALFLMICAAYLGASDELMNNTSGALNILAAFWLVVNCLSTSAYGLQIKLSQKQTKLKPYGCTYYNALVATPLTFIWTLWHGELQEFLMNKELFEPKYLMSLSLSSLIGFGIGFSVFWCISATSPTTYSMVGAANKIPLAILGIVLFSEPVTINRVSFISLGLLAGLLYARSRATLASRRRSDDKRTSRGKDDGAKDHHIVYVQEKPSAKPRREDILMSTLKSK